MCHENFVLFYLKFRQFQDHLQIILIDLKIVLYVNYIFYILILIFYQKDLRFFNEDYFMFISIIMIIFIHIYKLNNLTFSFYLHYFIFMQIKKLTYFIFNNLYYYVQICMNFKFR